MNTRRFRTHVLIVSCLMLMACYRTPLELQAKSIIISREEPACCCKYVSDLVAREGKAYNAYFAPIRQLEIGAMNQLRNRAFELNANYVYLLTPRTNYIGRLNPNWLTLPEYHAVTYYAKAYVCPPTRYEES